MSQWKHRAAAAILLAPLAAVCLLAQTESQIESDQVKRVGTHLSCKCQSCNENLNCMMSSGQCHFCKPARTKIFRMQQAGMTDSAIVANFVQEYGPDIYRRDPNSFFWLVPYIALAMGGALIFLVLRRFKRTPAAEGVPQADERLSRYRDTIERDMSNLD